MPVIVPFGVIQSPVLRLVTHWKQPRLAEEFRSDVNGIEVIQREKRQRIHAIGWVEDGTATAATAWPPKTVSSP